MRFKCYRQLEHSDCGLTCIRMVARHYGTRASLRYLHSIADLNRLGMSIRDITGVSSATSSSSPSDPPTPPILQSRHKSLTLHCASCILSTHFAPLRDTITQ
ncbi:MAG: hypothetical protein K2M04_06620 [Muribaculaceae bacterium]|nr:hypothetical protein [Muribaculaceae bacterium]